MLQAKPHIGIRCEVKHDVGARHCLGERSRVENVTLDETEACIAPRIGEKFGDARRHIVVANDALPQSEQPIGQRAADESGGAGDEGTTERREFRHHGESVGRRATPDDRRPLFSFLLRPGRNTQNRLQK